MVTPPRVISPESVYRQLLSIKPVLSLLDQGELDHLCLDAIDSAQAEFERETRLFLWPRRVLTYPTSSDVFGGDGVTGTYDMTHNQFDFYQSGYRSVGYFTARHRPCLSVQRLSVEYGAGLILLTYPPAWIRVDVWNGIINVMPISALGAGPTYGLLQPEFWLPLLSGGWLNGVIPLIVSIDYTVGFPFSSQGAPYLQVSEDAQFGDLRIGLAQMASLIVRESVMELVPQSVSADGVPISFPSFQLHTTQLRQLVEEFKASFKQQYSPIQMAVV